MRQTSSPTPSSLAEARAAYEAMTPSERAAFAERERAERDRRYRACVRRLRESTAANRIRYSGIPEAYLSARVADCGTGVRQYAAALEVGVRESLMMRGKAGTGKTHAACAVLIAAAPLMTIRFTTVPAFLREVNGVWIRRDRTPAEVFEDYARCGLLVLDDVGKEPPRETSSSMLWELVDRRKADGLPTVYTTNYGGKELFARIAEGSDAQTAAATVDRIKQSNVILFDGPSRRERCGTVKGE